MRTNGLTPQRKGPWKPMRDAKSIIAIDPGRCYAAAGWNGALNQIVIAQGSTHKSDVPVVHVMGKVVEEVELAMRLFSLYGGIDVVALEYPIPFYRASRESIAAVNLHAGVWAALSQGAWDGIGDIQMFSPGNSKNLHVWNNKGEGVAEAEAWLASCPHKCIHKDSVDSALDTDLTEACRTFPKFLDCAKVRLTKDAVSAVGILLCAMRYNNIPLPCSLTSVFYVQL